MNIPLFYKCFESCYFLLCMMKTWKSDVLKKILSVRIKKTDCSVFIGTVC